MNRKLTLIFAAVLAASILIISALAIEEENEAVDVYEITLNNPNSLPVTTSGFVTDVTNNTDTVINLTAGSGTSPKIMIDSIPDDRIARVVDNSGASINVKAGSENGYVLSSLTSNHTINLTSVEYFAMTTVSTDGGYLSVSCSGGVSMASGTTSSYTIKVSSSATWYVASQTGGDSYANGKPLKNHKMTVVDGAQTYTIALVPNNSYNNHYRAENMWMDDGTTSYAVGGSPKAITGDMTVKGNFIRYSEFSLIMNGTSQYHPTGIIDVSSPAYHHEGKGGAKFMVDMDCTVAIMGIPHDSSNITRAVHDSTGHNVGSTTDKAYVLTISRDRGVSLEDHEPWYITVYKSVTGGTVSASFSGEGVSLMDDLGDRYKITVDLGTTYHVTNPSSTLSTDYLTKLYSTMVITDGSQVYTLQINPNSISDGYGYRTYGYKVQGNLTIGSGTIIYETARNITIRGNDCIKFYEVTITENSNSITANYSVTRASNTGPAFSGVLKKSGSTYTNTITIEGYSSFNTNSNVVYVDSGKNITITATTSTSSYIVRVVDTPKGSSSGSPINIGTGNMAFVLSSMYKAHTLDITQVRAYTITASSVTGGTISATGSGGKPLITGSGSGPYSITVAEGAGWSIVHESTAVNDNILKKRFNKMTINDGAQTYTIIDTPSSSNTEGHRVYGFNVGGTLKLGDSGTVTSNLTVTGNHIQYKVIGLGLPQNTTNKITVYYSVTRADGTGPAYSGYITRSPSFNNRVTVEGYSQYQINDNDLYLDVGQSVTFTAKTTNEGYMVKVKDVPNGGSASALYNINLDDNFVLDSVTIPHSVVFSEVRAYTIHASSVEFGTLTASGSGGHPLITGGGSEPYTITVAQGSGWTLSNSESTTYFENNVNLTIKNVLTLVDGAQTYTITCSLEPPDVATATAGHRIYGFMNGETAITGSGTVGNDIELTGNYVQYYVIDTSTDGASITTNYEIGSPESQSTIGLLPGYRVLVDAGADAQFSAVTSAEGKIVRVSDNEGASTNVGTGAPGDVAKYTVTEVAVPHTLVFSDIVPTVVTVNFPLIGDTVIDTTSGNPNIVNISGGREIRVDPQATWTVTNTAAGTDLLLKRHNLLTIVDGAQTYTIDVTQISLNTGGARAYGFMIDDDLKLSEDAGDFIGLTAIVISPNIIKTHTVRLSLEDLDMENFIMYDESPDDSWFSGTISLNESDLTGTATIIDDKIPGSPIIFSDILAVDGYVPIQVDDGCTLKFYPNDSAPNQRIYDTPDGSSKIGPFNAINGYVLENVTVGHTLDLYRVESVSITITVEQQGRITVSGSASIIVEGDGTGIIDIAKGSTWRIESADKMVIDDLDVSYVLNGSSLSSSKYFHSFTSDGSQPLSETGMIDGEMSIIGHLEEVIIEEYTIKIKPISIHGKVQVKSGNGWELAEYGRAKYYYVTAGSTISTGPNSELIINGVTIAKPYDVDEGYECSWCLYDGNVIYHGTTVPDRDLLAEFDFQATSPILTIPEDREGYRIFENDKGHEITKSKPVAIGTSIIVEVETGYHVVKAEYGQTEGISDMVDFTDSLSFSMPSYDTTMTVTVDDRYTLTFDDTRLKVTADGIQISSGDKVSYNASVMVSANEGLVIKSLYYNHGETRTDITSVCEFTMPAEDVSLTVAVGKDLSLTNSILIALIAICLLTIPFLIFYKGGRKRVRDVMTSDY